MGVLDEQFVDEDAVAHDDALDPVDDACRRQHLDDDDLGLVFVGVEEGADGLRHERQVGVVDL